MSGNHRQSCQALLLAALYGSSAALCPSQSGPVAPQSVDWRAPPGKDFPVFGGNLGNQRYSSLTSITPANIAKLGAAWMVHVADGASGANLEGTPLVVDGVMYL